MRRDIPPLPHVREITQKKRDAWWTVLLVDPVATPLVRWTAIHTRLTPDAITWLALLLGLGAAACFALADWQWLLLGALLYHLSFVLDCMDGKLARLTGTGSIFGAWLDYVFDRIRVLACAIALMGGQYAATGEVVYLWLALAVVFLDMLRYLDALQIFKVRHEMRKQLKARAQRAREAENAIELAFMEDLLRVNPSADAESDRDARATEEARERARRAMAEGTAPTGTEPAGTGPGTGAVPTGAPRPTVAVVDLHREFRSRFPWYLRCRSFLLRHRIRTHLVSGIEFQMAVFIIAPALNAVVPVTIVAGVLLLVFELAIIYKLQLSTRDFGRTLAEFDLREERRRERERELRTASGAGASVVIPAQVVPASETGGGSGTGPITAPAAEAAGEPV
ncbi:CDP-alcohol phosphatidyltransferase family protein [Streptomyces alkaliphilus]|uniref:CDP-alcohol phosphatidyltransferase family protein n=1 Tax=Streptomyces alkaliphilus TaxID=1472722 RepID=UPI00117E8A5C|nr:CDP-alcohol phosphatidyltransferase family protein [Streptomyces alkaliphilus]MQS08107.1 CDP-alcohol phosphatidyltransferase family protein [Streptomyces alkaliphilus]